CRPSNGCGGGARLAGPSQVPVGPLSRHSFAPKNRGQPATGTGPFNCGRSLVDDDIAADVGRLGPRTGMVARAVSGIRHERIDRRANVLAIRIICSANGMDSRSRPRLEPFSFDLFGAIRRTAVWVAEIVQCGPSWCKTLRINNLGL